MKKFGCALIASVLSVGMSVKGVEGMECSEQWDCVDNVYGRDCNLAPKLICERIDGVVNSSTLTRHQKVAILWEANNAIGGMFSCRLLGEINNLLGINIFSLSNNDEYYFMIAQELIMSQLKDQEYGIQDDTLHFITGYSSTIISDALEILRYLPLGSNNEFKNLKDKLESSI